MLLIEWASRPLAALLSSVVLLLAVQASGQGASNTSSSSSSGNGDGITGSSSGGGRRGISPDLAAVERARNEGAFVYNAPESLYVVVMKPADFVSAARGCSSMGMVVMPWSVAVHTFSELMVLNSTYIAEIMMAVTLVVSGAPKAQKGWDLWVWDVSRPCRASSYMSLVESFFQTTDRPCDWLLSYICMDLGAALAAGFKEDQLSEAWLQRVDAALAQPSPYALGRTASGITFVQSDLVIGAAEPPDGAHWYDGRDQFFSEGPLMTLMWNSRPGAPAVYAILPVHEASHSVVQALLEDPQGITGLPGFMGKNVLAEGAWEGNHVGSWPDYIVRVQGCWNEYGVERLVLITRTGMAHGNGRGECTEKFVEDAPPGGYLAALQGWHSSEDRTLDDTIMDRFNVYQLRLVWATTDPRVTPTYIVERQPTVNASACPSARKMFPSVPDNQPPECGEAGGWVCPTHMCCGDVILKPPARVPVQVCGRGLGPCKVSCRKGYGACMIAPEKELLLFTQRPPPLAAILSPAADDDEPTVYAANLQTEMSYKDAVQYCRDLTQVGLEWVMVDIEDLLHWVAAPDMRMMAYQTLFKRKIWVAVDPAIVDISPSTGCLQCAFSLMSHEPMPLHIATPCSCTINAMVVCKAAASQNATSVGVPANGRGLPEFQAGYHLLSVSEPLGAGPSGASCDFHTIASIPDGKHGNHGVSSSPSAPSVAPAPPNQPLAPALDDGFVSSSTLPGYLTLPITHIRISVATSKGWSTGSTEQLSAIQLLLQGVPEGLYGTVSSDGWHTLALQGVEAVTAVSGCAGGYVERLVIHTSYGRRWSTPFSRTSQCTAPFFEEAPPGGYLVGLQGVTGFYLEQLQLVWAQPLSALVPPAAPQEGGGLVPSAAIGIGVGVGAGLLILFLCAALAFVMWRRRATARRDMACGPPTLMLVSAKAGAESKYQYSEGAATSSIPHGEHSGPGTTSREDDTAKKALRWIAVGVSGAPAAPSTPIGVPPAHFVALDSADINKGVAAAAAMTNTSVIASSDPANATGLAGHCSSGGDGGGNDNPQQQAVRRPRGQSRGAAVTSSAAASASFTLVDDDAASDGTIGGSGGAALVTSPSGRSMTGPPNRAWRTPSSIMEIAGFRYGPGTPVQTREDVDLFDDSQRPDAPVASRSMTSGEEGNRWWMPPVCTTLQGDAHLANVVWVPQRGGEAQEEEQLRADPALNLQLGKDVLVDSASYLGHGGSGVVRRGKLHTPEGYVPVAVKMLAETDASETAAGLHLENLRGLAQEIRVLSRLAHPHIVRFFGARLDPTCCFIVEELMSTSLNKLVHAQSRATGSFQHEYGLVDVLRISREMAMGLSYLHPTVVHRDLKPGNVLLDEHGVVKIGDFGLARFKANTALTTRDIEVGTAPYMAPEVFLANSDVKVTDRSDVYSLGVIMNEMIVRKAPWGGMRPVVIGFQVAMERKRPTLPGPDCPLCPPGLRSLIQRCWRHNPDERPSSAEIVKRLTLLLAENTGGLAPSIQPPSRPQSQPQRHPLVGSIPNTVGGVVGGAVGGPSGSQAHMSPAPDPPLTVTSPSSSQQHHQQHSTPCNADDAGASERVAIMLAGSDSCTATQVGAAPPYLASMSALDSPLGTSPRRTAGTGYSETEGRPVSDALPPQSTASPAQLANAPGRALEPEFELRAPVNSSR